MSKEKITKPKNPKTALNAVASPRPLTLGQIAVLERIKSPILHGDTNDTTQNIVAVYALKSGVKASEVFRQLENQELVDKALEWSAELNPKKFMSDVADILDSVAEFWAMLPRPEEDNGDGKSKKATASGTASSQS